MKLTYSLENNRRQRKQERDAVVAKRRFDRYVAKTVDAAPPLTNEQRDRLALLLRGSRI